MRMRYKPLRGEKYRTKNFGFVTVLETIKATNDDDHSVKVLTEKELVNVIPIRELPLHTIDTKDYEKFKKQSAGPL